jgi:hypothetical protein
VVSLQVDSEWMEGKAEGKSCIREDQGFGRVDGVVSEIN